MDNTSCIAVLGASGMVGNAITRKLINSNYRTILATYNKNTITFESNAVKTVHLDATNQHEVECFFKEYNPRYVFLAAAKVGGILANNTYKAEFIYNNTAIALNVIHSAYRYGVKKLLNLGSSCIYPRLAPQPLKEEYLLTGSLEPTNEPYAIAKIAAIKLCRYYNEQYGSNFISVMPTNLYGPHDNYNLETAHVLPALLRKLHLAKLLEEGNFDGIVKNLQTYPIGFGLTISQKPYKDEILSVLSKLGITQKSSTNNHQPVTIITLWGSGLPYREFMHVDDLASACVFLMQKYNYDAIGEFVNIGTGVDMPIKELAAMIKDIVGFNGSIVWDTSKPDGTPRKLLDVSRIRALGWQYRIGLEEGITKVYNIMKKG